MEPSLFPFKLTVDDWPTFALLALIAALIDFAIQFGLNSLLLRDLDGLAVNSTLNAWICLKSLFVMLAVVLAIPAAIILFHVLMLAII